jgi:hypothetical protein
MAVINGLSDLATKQAAALKDRSSGIINMEDASGILLVAHAKFTVLTTQDATSVITLVPAAAIPVGATFVPELSNLFIGTTSANLAVDVGPASDPDNFADALLCSTAGLKWFGASATIPAGFATPYKFTSQEAILLTIAVAGGTETICQATLVFRAKA